jgi:hypothetical protein
MNYFLNTFLKQENFFLKIFLILGLFISWSSISTNFYDITTIFSTNKINFILLVNFLRSTAVIIYFIIILFFSIFFYQKTSFKIKDNIFYFFIFLYFLAHIPGLLLTDNSLVNMYYVVSSLNVILIFSLAHKVFDETEIKLFAYITFFYLAIIFFLYFTKDAIKFFTYVDGGHNGSFYSNYTGKDVLFGMIPPRSTGLSRSAILLMLFLTLFSFKLKNKHIRYATIIFFSTVVFLYQSRTSVGLLFGVAILEIFFLSKYNLIAISKKLAIYIFIPFVVFTGVTLIKSTIYLNNLIEKKIDAFSHCEVIISHRVQQINYDPYFIKQCWLKKRARPFSIRQPFKFLQNTQEIKYIRAKVIRGHQQDFSSNRYSDWGKIVSFYKDTNELPIIFFGHGAQGDRFLIKQSAANGLFYALASSGIIGVIFLLIALINLLIHGTFFVISLKNKLKKDPFYIYIIMIIVILTRSILESSFAVFGIDFMVLIMCVTMLLQKLKDKKII